MKHLKTKRQLELIPTERLEPNRADYQPLASVWYGTDADLLVQMLDFYPRQRPQRILDATVNQGRFWKANSYPVIGLDIDLACQPDVLADNMAMPFQSESFDVVVYDPPHVPNQGKDQSKDFNTRFGLVLILPQCRLPLPGMTMAFPRYRWKAFRISGIWNTAYLSDTNFPKDLT